MGLLKNYFELLPLGFGCAAISGEGGGYGFGKITTDQSVNLLRSAFDLGVRVFDTAPIYGYGLSEQRLGKAFKQNRDEIFIISKSGITWHPSSRVNMTNDPKVTQKMLEQSLRDLDSDYIDLYMIHWPDEKVDIRRPLEVLAKAQKDQKIKHVGLCNTNMNDLKKAKEIVSVEVVQSQLNIFENNVIDELFPYLNENNISFMSWGTLDKGIITGRVDRERSFDESDARSWAPWWKKSNKDEKIEKMNKILPLLKENNISGLQLALGYNLSCPEVEMVLCGMKNLDQLTSTIESLKKLPNKKTVEVILDALNG